MNGIKTIDYTKALENRINELESGISEVMVSIISRRNSIMHTSFSLLDKNMENWARDLEKLKNGEEGWRWQNN